MIKKLFFFSLLFQFVYPQGYTSFFTGNATNITTTPSFGICLMGGATENDNAMKWLLQKANGGDVVVLRSSGSDGYNNYFYSELGIPVNSVETLVITSATGATNPYVLNKVSQAELIWIAGGNQANYVNFFKNNALEDLLNNHVNNKQAPIGGTSAGMAILGSHYFAALNGSVTSSQVLANPFHQNATLGGNDFLVVPYLQNVITDTHYDNPDRRARQTTFMARIAQELNNRSFGIASNEYTAVCVEANGRARVFGDFPNYQEFAYFLQTNCENEFLPEVLQPNTPITWNRNGRAVKVYKVPGTQQGTNYFELSDWVTGSGGSWEDWYIINGVFAASTGIPTNCILSSTDFLSTNVKIYPIPSVNEMTIEKEGTFTLKIFDINGRKLFTTNGTDKIIVDTSKYETGIYILKIDQNGREEWQKIIKN